MVLTPVFNMDKKYYFKFFTYNFNCTLLVILKVK